MLLPADPGRLANSVGARPSQGIPIYLTPRPRCYFQPPAANSQRVLERRNGITNLFMLFAPLEGWLHVKVTDHHTVID